MALLPHYSCSIPGSSFKTTSLSSLCRTAVRGGFTGSPLAAQPERRELGHNSSSSPQTWRRWREAKGLRPTPPPSMHTGKTRGKAPKHKFHTRSKWRSWRWTACSLVREPTSCPARALSVMRYPVRAFGSVGMHAAYMHRTHVPIACADRMCMHSMQPLCHTCSEPPQALGIATLNARARMALAQEGRHAVGAACRSSIHATALAGCSPAGAICPSCYSSAVCALLCAKRRSAILTRCASHLLA